MFRAHVLIVSRAKLYYTASGVITTIGGHPVHGTATYSCDDTRDCIVQFCPPNDEHMCSKHVEAWNKLIIKFSASSWLILINKYKRFVVTILLTHKESFFTRITPHTNSVHVWVCQQATNIWHSHETRDILCWCPEATVSIVTTTSPAAGRCFASTSSHQNLTTASGLFPAANSEDLHTSSVFV